MLRYSIGILYEERIEVRSPSRILWGVNCLDISRNSIIPMLLIVKYRQTEISYLLIVISSSNDDCLLKDFEGRRNLGNRINTLDFLWWITLDFRLSLTSFSPSTPSCSRTRSRAPSTPSPEVTASSSGTVSGTEVKTREIDRVDLGSWCTCKNEEGFESAEFEFCWPPFCGGWTMWVWKKAKEKGYYHFPIMEYIIIYILEIMSFS